MLGSFARSSLRRPRPAEWSGDTPTCRPGSIWPLPPPFPQVLRCDPWRLPDDQLKKLVVNAMVITLNYLDIGNVERAPETCIAGRRLHPGQREHASRLESFLTAWFELGTLTAAEMGRTGRLKTLRGYYRSSVREVPIIGELRCALPPVSQQATSWADCRNKGWDLQGSRGFEIEVHKLPRL